MAQLDFLANSPAFIALIGDITGYPHIQRFDGRVYRRTCAGDHYDTWHDDIHANVERLVGLSINLSVKPYAGGVFQMRETETKAPLLTLPNTVFGDAIVFRIREDLEHRVSPVEGPIAKTAFAGWFSSKRRSLFASMQDRFGKSNLGSAE